MRARRGRIVRRLERLRIQAIEATTARGHTLERFRHYGPPWAHRLANARCAVCRREVHINARPYPNEIDIGGRALAINCGDTESE